MRTQAGRLLGLLLPLGLLSLAIVGVAGAVTPINLHVIEAQSYNPDPPAVTQLLPYQDNDSRPNPMAATIQSYVNKILQKSGLLQRDDSVTVKVIGNTPTLPPHSRLSLDTALGDHLAPQGMVRVTITDPNGVSRQFGVSVKITVQRPVWVVQQPITAGDSLSGQKLAWLPRPVTPGSSPALDLSTADLEHYQARVVLRPGDVLDARKVTQAPWVHRNTQVRILMTNHQGLNIALLGVALEDGAEGQWVKVRQQANTAFSPVNRNNPVTTAKVVEKNQVLVEL